MKIEKLKIKNFTKQEEEGVKEEVNIKLVKNWKGNKRRWKEKLNEFCCWFNYNRQ